MFPTFEIFCQVMDACTENFECLVIHNNAKSNKLEDQVFWYKAEEHPNFKMCDEHFWNNNNDGDDSSDDEEEILEKQKEKIK